MIIKAMKQALEALERSNGIDTDTEFVTIDVADEITSLRQAITELEKNEPVGWMDKKGNMICVKINELCEPLYTHPQPKQKPLTDEMTKQMKEFCDSAEMRGAFVNGWRSAEKHHGIGE